MTLEQLLPAVADPKEQALWLLEDVVPGTGVNNLNTTFRTAGRLRPDLVAETVGVLLRRYEVLRRVFRPGPAGPVRETLPPRDARIDVVRDDLTGRDLDGWLAAFVARPFRPDGELLLRAAHLADGPDDVVCVVVHHANFDGRSSALLQDAFTAVYDALAAGTAVDDGVVPVWTEPPSRSDSESYWRARLDGLDPAALELACAKPEPPVTTLAGAVRRRTLSPAARDAARRMQRDLRAPESVVLTAAYGVLLAAHGAGPDLTIGSPANVRAPGAERAIGYHANVLILRTPLVPAESFRSFVRLNRREFFAAMAHADYSAERILEFVPRTARFGRNNLFRHTFNYAPADTRAGFTIGGRPAAPLAVENGSSKFDLEFFVTSTPAEIEVRAGFGTDVLDPADVELMLARYDELLVTLAERPDEALSGLPVWAERDRELIGAANDTARPVEPATVLAAVAAAAAGPDRTAIVDGDRRVGLHRLWAAAEATRDRLAAAGVGPGDVVALLAPRSPELVAAVFGCWLAGAAYLPLSPDHPEQRLSYQLDDSGATLVLAADGITVPGDRRALALVGVDEVTPGPVRPLPPVTADDQAYLIYTSGSTGRPKGTRIGHGALANLIAHFTGALDARGRSVLWVTTFSFDMSTLELFLPLAAGGTLVIAPDEARTDGTVLAAALAGADIVSATPTTWRLVAGEVAAHLAGRTVIIGGEPLPAALARTLTATGCTLVNLYGPTECTVWSTGGVVAPGTEDAITVGVPVANTTVHIADEAGRDLPIGVRGELCIGGAGLSFGYHHRPELDAERFGEHPVHGRFYRTGDLARWTHDGRLEILGRRDRQIKLRGNRIELGEVEEVLRAHPSVTGAAVVLSGDPSGDGALWAFVTTTGGTDPAERLWEHANELLPAAAVPHEFVVLPAFPMTGSDKVDYPALQRHAADLRSARRSPAVPAPAGDDPVALVTGLFATLLERADLGPDSNFFASGGHSVLGVKLLQELHAATGVRLGLRELFDTPTPAALAARVPH